MNQSRNGPATCLFDQRWIYIMSGFDVECNNRQRSFEIYDTICPDKGFKLITITTGPFEGCNRPGAIQIDEK